MVNMWITMWITFLDKLIMLWYNIHRKFKKGDFMVKLFVALFVVAMIGSVFILATLGAKRSHKEWAEILGNNNGRRNDI